MNRTNPLFTGEAEGEEDEIFPTWSKLNPRLSDSDLPNTERTS